jgi:hypothetical protein
MNQGSEAILFFYLPDNTGYEAMSAYTVAFLLTQPVPNRFNMAPFYPQGIQGL